MTWQQYLLKLKNTDVHREWLYSYSLEFQVQVVTAWAMSDARIDDALLPTFHELKTDQDRFEQIWTAVSFDQKKFKALIHENTPQWFFFKFIKSRAIYPDGTYNLSWIENIVNPPPPETKESE